eukprot:jgi/Psemu1/305662/fgenesh1_kg.211_\
MSCSVEEISQISEITMDMPTIDTEQHQKPFAHCSPGLPTISEAEQYDGPGCATGVRSKAQCSAGTDTTRNKNDGNNDIIDFVFDLVEDAFCKPIHPSKSERKKAFMEAFYEESERVVKTTKKKSSKQSLRETSKHTRSSSSTKSSSNRKHGRSTSVTSDGNEGLIVDP